MPGKKQRDEQIVPGISINRQGEATVDPTLSATLLDLAEQLGDQTGLPVDLEHVLAAVVMASRTGRLPANQPLDSSKETESLLLRYVQLVFSKYDGKTAADD